MRKFVNGIQRAIIRNASAIVHYDGRKREFENIESLIFNLNSNNSSAYFQPPLSFVSRRRPTRLLKLRRNIPSTSFSFLVSFLVSSCNNKKEYAHDQNVV